jgi:hypothetical protein
MHVIALERAAEAAGAGMVDGIGLGVVAWLAHAHEAGERREGLPATGDADNVVDGNGRLYHVPPQARLA